MILPGRTIGATGWFVTGIPILQVAQYAPWNRVSRKPMNRRRSFITVSAIMRPPHRLHSIVAFPLSRPGRV
jgi:hypothetical protein